MDKELTETVSPQDKKIRRDSFIFFRSYAEALEELSDDSYVRIMKAISHFALDGDEPKLEGLEKSFFLAIKPVLLNSVKKYENGKKGGRPKSIVREKPNETKAKPNETKAKPNETKAKPNETKQKQPITNKDMDKDMDMELDNAIDKDLDNNSAASPQRGKKFKPPTLIEVENYCAERGLQIDAERFIDHYASNGWRVGNSPMKDWQAAVRNWARRNMSAHPDRANPDRAALPDSSDMSKYYS